MKNHVTSLEISKEMKELGFPQKSNFYWGVKSLTNRKITVALKKEFPGVSEYRAYQRNGEIKGGTTGYRYSAYLSSELSEMMPSEIKRIEGEEEIYYGITMDKDSDGNEWDVYYVNREWDIHTQSDKRLCNAMAKCLVELAKQGIINPQEL